MLFRGLYTVQEGYMLKKIMMILVATNVNRATYVRKHRLTGTLVPI